MYDYWMQAHCYDWSESSITGHRIKYDRVKLFTTTVLGTLMPSTWGVNPVRSWFFLVKGTLITYDLNL